MSQSLLSTMRHAVIGTASQKGDNNKSLSQKLCARLTESIDPNTKLKYRLVLGWIVSSVFAPLPLRMSLLLNHALVLSSLIRMLLCPLPCLAVSPYFVNLLKDMEMNECF